MLSEETSYFFNQLPNLYKALKKAKRARANETLVESYLSKSFSDDLKDKRKRFLEIPSVGFISTNMEYFPLYYELMQLYINGFYYSTIVLSGVLCERICYDVLSKKKISVEARSLSLEQIACLFEMFLRPMFELLYEWDLIKKGTRNEMHLINDKRNEYVHPKKSKSKAQKQKDAFETIKRITKILASEFEVKVEHVGEVRLG